MVIVLLCNFIKCSKNNEKKERIFSSQLQRFVSRNVKWSRQRIVHIISTRMQNEREKAREDKERYSPQQSTYQRLSSHTLALYKKCLKVNKNSQQWDIQHRSFLGSYQQRAILEAEWSPHQKPTFLLMLDFMASTPREINVHSL